MADKYEKGNLDGSVKKYCVELYNKKDLMEEDWCFATQKEQHRQYNILLRDGSHKDDIELKERDFFM